MHLHGSTDDLKCLRVRTQVAHSAMGYKKCAGHPVDQSPPGNVLRDDRSENDLEETAPESLTKDGNFCGDLALGFAQRYRR